MVGSFFKTVPRERRDYKDLFDEFVEFVVLFYSCRFMLRG